MTKQLPAHLMPEDRPLGQPVRKFSETFSVYTVLKQKFPEVFAEFERRRGQELA